MGFVELFMVPVMTVLKMLIITVVGLFLALERVDLLGSIARNHLNNLVFYVFTPALVASSLAETITTSNIVTLWFMPVNILVTFIIGSALGNLGSMLLIIIPAVYEEKNSPFGDFSTCSIIGEAYASLSMAIVTVYMWTYVYNILQPHGIKHSTTKDSLESEAQLAVPLIVFEDMEKEPFVRRMKQHINIWAERINLKMLFAPSTIATIVGIIIGVESLLRKLVIGTEAPLHVIHSSASLLGEAKIPAVILIVGANLLRGLKKSEIGMCVVIGVQVVRYVALPLCGIVVVKAARHFGLVGSDPLYHFVLLLQYAHPSAMTIGTVAQLFGVGESECSLIMLWNYAIASVALTLWTSYYMWFLS